ncbi:MAG TPA: hypothetical protein VLD62_10425, partial [Acidimicrobiia bacterium]|nr:hypothetical protein [Acidimicrobiia bacterium]
TTAAATTTAAPTTTTTAAPTTTADPAAAARVARISTAAALAGTWEGEWRNTTFGSDGPIDAEVTVNVEAAFALMTVDLGGFVFGADDPEPATIEFDLVVPSPYETRFGVFGRVETDIAADGSFTMVAADVPGDRIASMVVEGQITPTSLTATYTIEFEGGGDPALGEVEVTKTG